VSDLNRRVVMTGFGAVTPLGNSLVEYWDGVRSGRSGAGPITYFDSSDYTTQIAAEVKDFDPTVRLDRKEARRMDPFCQFGTYAALEALENSGLEINDDNAERIGVIIGSGIGGLNTIENQHRVLQKGGPRRVSPFMIPMLIADMASGLTSIITGAKGPNYATVSACASSAHAIGDSLQLIRTGKADAMITGGAESSITPLGMAGFCSARAMSTRNDEPERASRPFDVNRDGFVSGEGSGILILEELERAKARGATIYGEVLGFGYSADAYHLTAPPENGEGMMRSMTAALDDAAIDPTNIDYINAHGTSTEVGDVAESAAIKGVFGDHAHTLAVSSTKSMTGHLLGAAGAVESIATAMGMHEGVLPPTINLEDQDPRCDLDYIPNETREKQAKFALSNSFGFGGHNASLVLGAFAG
jgi:3-oxoacyl-[acyl-carrier-protein] synthase II